MDFEIRKHRYLVRHPCGAEAGMPAPKADGGESGGTPVTPSQGRRPAGTGR